MSELFNGKKSYGSRNKPKTFKIKNAQRRHQETLQEIAAQRKTEHEPIAGTSSSTT